MENYDMYKCVLIGKNNVVIETFFRDGWSREEVLEGLNCYQWPEGRWEIELDGIR